MQDYNEICAIWKSFEISDRYALENHLDSFRILFAYHSGKLENGNITYDDTKEIFESDSLTAYTGDLRTVFEIQNQKICYEYLIDKIIDKQPLSIELIKSVHKRLARGTYDYRRYHVNGERPGEYKKKDYVVGPEEVGFGAHEVAGAMEEMVSQVNGHMEDPLVAAAYFHAWFEYIHPFADANGIAGRTLMNYYLMINGHPPIIIYNEDKQAYLEALRVFDDTEELAPFIDFLKKMTVKTWQKRMARYDEVTGKPNDKSYFERGLPPYLEESIKNMKASWMDRPVIYVKNFLE